MNRKTLLLALGWLGSWASPLAQTIYPQELSSIIFNTEDVRDFKLSPDGTRVVFRASKFRFVVNMGSELNDRIFSVPVTGGPPVDLTGGLTFEAQAVCENYEISADGSRVVFLADKDVVGRRELYSVPIGGGTPVKLNGPLIAGGEVFSAQISPSSDRVAYVAAQGSLIPDLCSVPITGGANGSLSGGQPGTGVINLQISPDGSRVIYLADPNTSNQDELFSVPITGGGSTKIAGSIPGGGVDDFEISPTGERVVLRGDIDEPGRVELFSVSINGGSRPRLHPPLLGAGETINNFKVSPDGTQVVFQGIIGGGTGRQVYASTIDSGSARQLSPVTVAQGATLSYRISPDSQRVLYLGETTTLGTWELLSVPISGGVPTILNGPLAPGGSLLRIEDVGIDGRVLYTADQDTEGVRECYSVPIEGESAVKINGPLPASGDVRSEVFFVPVPPRIAAGGRVVYLADQEEDEILELYVGKAQEFWRPSTGEWLTGGNWAGGAPAELEFAGEVTTEEGRGTIVGSESILRFPNLLQNAGSLSLASGLNTIFGDIVNRQEGLVVVTGGATAVFFDDFLNDANVNVSAAGATVSTTVFLGSLTGNGIGGSGSVFIEGDTRPGESPGTMAFGGDLSYGPFAEMNMEIGGTTPGTEHDQITVAGHLSLDGTLTVTLINDFVPEVGMVFDLWDAGSVSGQYTTVNLPALPAGLFWNTCFLNTTGELFVALVPDSYAGFAAHYGLAAPPEGDEEGDQIPNVIEYFAARNPLQLDVWPAIEPGAGGISFVTAVPAAKDLVVELERSTTLQPTGPGGWEVIATRTGIGPWSGAVPVNLSAEAPGLERARVTHTIAGEARRFYRLKVTLVP